MMTGRYRSTVVVGVDGSPDARAAVDYAATEAVRRHLPLRLVHGLRPPAAYSMGSLVAIDVSRILADLRAMLAAVAAEVQIRYPGLEAEIGVTAGVPAAVLVEESRSAALVVVGSRGIGGFRGRLVGSVSAQVAAYAHAPVIVVRPPVPGEPGMGVVVGVDGSPGSPATLEFAFDEAAAHGNRLVAVYAWEAHPQEVDAQREADRALAELLAGWPEKYPDVIVERRAVHSRDPVGTLLAESRNAALVVVGHRGRGGFAGLRLGSVSDGLVRHACRTVAVVHGGMP
jgi:nucleotide-binding universal stress UspA family protein